MTTKPVAIRDAEALLRDVEAGRFTDANALAEAAVALLRSIVELRYPKGVRLPAEERALRAAARLAAKRAERKPFDNGDGTFTVPLTRGMVAVVDASDVAAIEQHPWRAFKPGRSNTWYAYANFRQPDGSRRHVAMHRWLMQQSDPAIKIDHRDGNGLNNRRSNLRLATNAQNQSNRGKPRNNTSGFKGVRKVERRWVAHITHGGKSVYLGSFSTAEDAHAAYCEAAKRLHGEFARTA